MIAPEGLGTKYALKCSSTTAGNGKGRPSEGQKDGIWPKKGVGSWRSDESCSEARFCLEKSTPAQESDVGGGTHFVAAQAK